MSVEIKILQQSWTRHTAHLSTIPPSATKVGTPSRPFVHCPTFSNKGGHAIPPIFPLSHLQQQRWARHPAHLSTGPPSARISMTMFHYSIMYIHTYLWNALQNNTYGNILLFYLRPSEYFPQECIWQ